MFTKLMIILIASIFTLSLYFLYRTVMNIKDINESLKIKRLKKSFDCKETELQYLQNLSSDENLEDSYAFVTAIPIVKHISTKPKPMYGLSLKKQNF